jgi:hypothetical protein
MGYQAVRTPDMGDLSVEIRSESFYLAGLRGICYGPAGSDTTSFADDAGGFLLELYLDDIDQVIAALQQAKRIHLHDADYQWVNGAGEPVEVVCPPTDVRHESLVLSADDQVALLRSVPERLAASVQAISSSAFVPIAVVHDVLTAAEEVSPEMPAVAVLRAALDQVQTEYLDKLRASGVVGAPPAQANEVGDEGLGEAGG